MLFFRRSLHPPRRTVTAATPKSATKDTLYASFIIYQFLVLFFLPGSMA
jgi:hypothetical protein